MPHVPVAEPSARLPADAAADIAYVGAEFEPIDDALRSTVEDGVLPQATYVMPDGTPMVPRDHARLLADAGERAEDVAGLFRRRYLAAGGSEANADEELAAWLSGEYGACLYSTTPESIVAKDALMKSIEALLAGADPENTRWRGALRGAVEALDSIERPFAAHDRKRFGGPTSRDRLIAASRERFPGAFS